MKRFNVKVLLENPGPYEVWFEAEDDGAWITVADHEAALSEAVRKEREACALLALEYGALPNMIQAIRARSDK